MATVRTRRGDRGPHRRRFSGSGLVHSTATMIGDPGRFSRKDYERLADEYAKVNAGKRPDGNYVGVILESEDGAEQDTMYNFPTQAQAEIYGMYSVRSLGPEWFFRVYRSEDEQ